MRSMGNTPTLAARQDAIRDYLNSAEDKVAARAFVTDCLDPSADGELIDWLEDHYPETSTLTPAP
jgi:hypothetical protein